jgi:hypothetical protein
MQDEDDGLNGEVGKALIEALPNHPTLETACASCGKSSETVRNWVRRGQQPGAPELHARFARAFLKAEAAFAAWCHERWLTLISAPGGAKEAKVLLEFMDRRWKLGTSSDIMAAINQGPKRTDDLRALLMQPSPRVRALLNETGWRRQENWTPPTPMLPMPAAEE